MTDGYDYDAFGNLINQTGTTPNNYFFAGEQYDPALALYYNRARYLNATVGRFWTVDTKEPRDREPTSLHRYLYVGDNPVDRVDPSGLDFDIGSLAIAAGISGTLNAISAVRANATLSGVAKSFGIGALEGAAFFFAGAGLLKILATAGEAAASVEAVQAATQFIQSVVQRAGPLYEGLGLPKFFSLVTDAGEVFVKQNATEHLQELLLSGGKAGATNFAAAMTIDMVKALVEQVAAGGFDSIVGQRITTQFAGYTVEITIESQTGQAVGYAITHLLFIN